MVESKSRCTRILQFLDIFSYIPVPTAYPVSTNKSKIGSILFQAAMLGYVIFDFYNFVTNNVPIINVYKSDFINLGTFPLPKFAFGVLLSQKQGDGTTKSLIFNDEDYYYFVLQSYINIEYANKTSTYNYTQVPIIQCSQDTDYNWTKTIYSNLWCVNKNQQVINQIGVDYQILGSEGNMLIQQQYINGNLYNQWVRILVFPCNTSEPNNTCAASSQFQKVVKNSSLYIAFLQPIQLDYRNSKALGPDTNYKSYNFALTPNATSTGSVVSISTQFLIYPNFLTTFTKQIKQISQISRSTVSTGTSMTQQYFFRLRLWNQWIANIVENHPQTLIAKISEWSAFAGLILFIGGICFLGYNKNKFNKRNPEWERFDEALSKKKVEIQLQNLTPNNQMTSARPLQKNEKQAELETPHLEGNKVSQISNQLQQSQVIDDSNTIMKIRQKIMAQNKE